MFLILCLAKLPAENNFLGFVIINMTGAYITSVCQGVAKNSMATHWLAFIVIVWPILCLRYHSSGDQPRKFNIGKFQLIGNIQGV